MTITNSLLTANSVDDNDDGGAIYVKADGELTVIESTLSNNVAGRGGAIFAEGATATVIDSVIDGNYADDEGGGIFARNTVTISGTTISNNATGVANTAGTDRGGGIHNQGDLTLTDSTLSGNRADRGGGIYDIGGGSMTISGTTIHDNHALDGNSGGIRSNSRLIMIDSTISDNTSTDLGAGLYVASNTATITGTTISGNYSTDGAGGLFNSGTTTFTNGTISGNQADKDGGGVFNFGTLTFINSTISDNSAALQGDGFRLASGTITLQNTIIANSPDDNCYDSSGLPYNYYSLGGNLSDDDTCNFTESSDLNDTEADLGSLADNGGPTRTHLPQSGSPAIDHTACAVATDQRGIDRPQGADCDIGADEVLAAEQLPLCVNGYTGAVSTPWSGKCPPGQQTRPCHRDSRINPHRSGSLRWCWTVRAGVPTHLMPDDGALLTCVSRYTGSNRAVTDHTQCLAYELPNIIPATP